MISTFYSQKTGKNAVTKVIAYVFFLIADVFFGLHSSVTLIFAKKKSAITFKKKNIFPYSLRFFCLKCAHYIAVKMLKNTENE